MSTPPILDKLFAAMQGSKGLPALENTVTSVLGALNDAKKGNRDLVAHIVEDFALTQKVLKLANSSMYAPFADGSTSVSSALNVLGADALLHIVLSTAMVSAAELEGDEELSRTLLASELARKVCSDRSEDVSIAALMYDIGRLMASKYLPDEMAKIAVQTRAGAAPDAAAVAVIGLTLQQVGAEVARRWKLPEGIVSIIDGTGDQTLVGVAKFSSTASSLMHQGKNDEVQQLVAGLDFPGLDKSRLTAFVGDKIESMAPNLKLPTEAADEAALDALRARLTDMQCKTVEELAAAMFATLGDLLKTAHCLLFMLTRTGEFRVRYGAGKGIDELRSKLRLAAEFEPTTFHAVIKNNVDVSIADVTRLKPTALPANYRELLPNVNKFIILPVANSKVSGLVYCDWDGERTITPGEMAALRTLRNLFLPFFPA